MYGCSVAATAAAGYQGNADAAILNSIDANDDSVQDGGSSGDNNSSIEEDTGYKVGIVIYTLFLDN